MVSDYKNIQITDFNIESSRKNLDNKDLYENLIEINTLINSYLK